MSGLNRTDHVLAASSQALQLADQIGELCKPLKIVCGIALIIIDKAQVSGLCPCASS